MSTNRNGTGKKAFRLVAILLIAGLIVGGLALSVSATEYEEKIGEHEGVIAKSNGPCTAKHEGICEGVDCSISTNKEWQCVEYIVRFYKDAMGIDISKPIVPAANQYYGKGSAKGLTQYADGGSVPPYPCDILCFGGGSYGHVAIVTEVDDNYIYIVEQNADRDNAHDKIAWNKNTNKLSTHVGLEVDGWLRKDTWKFDDVYNLGSQYKFEGWEAINDEGYSIDGRKFLVNPKQTDPYIRSASLSLDADNYNAIEMNMASNCEDGNAKLYFTTTSSPSYSESKMIEFKVNNNGGWQTYLVYMANHELWKGTISGIRIDPAKEGRSSGVDTFGFDYIKVINTPKKPTIIGKDLGYYPAFNRIDFGYYVKNPFANDIKEGKV